MERSSKLTSEPKRLLSLQDVTVHYGAVEALKSVSLELSAGMIVTLVGANGAGKSTILKAISGLKKPTSGSIWLRGKRIDGIAPQTIVKRGIAHVPEGKRLFSEMTVLENLRMGAYLRNNKTEISEDVERVFKHFPALQQRYKQRAGSLSGGEQQMLAMGRGLMSKPELLLLDEPSLGLSPLMVEEIATIIEEINQSGISIILVEQNARLAFRLAVRGYVLETGKVILEGKTEDLERDERVKRAYLGI
jgi:branched-chain amino acid transport system ATP-binding protein